MDASSNNLTWYSFLRALPKHRLFLSVFYGLIRIVFSISWPYLLFYYIKNQDSININGLIAIIVSVISMFVIASVATYKQSRLNILMVEAWSLKLSEQMWKKMISLDWLTFHGKSRVYYFDLLMTDFWRFRQGMMAILETVIVNMVVVGALVLLICWISLPMFVLCVIGLLIVGGLHFYSSIIARPLFKKFHRAWSDQHMWIATSIDQFDLIRMDRAYDETEGKHKSNTLNFLGANTSMYTSQAYWKSVNQIAGNLLRVIVFIIGIYWIKIDFISLTNFLFVLFIVSIIQNNLAQVPSGIFNFLEGKVAALNITAFFALPAEEESNTKVDKEEITTLASIHIKNLDFAYFGKEVLTQKELFLEKGKIYLWRGANGSGKSTFAHILLGFLQPEKGSLHINETSHEWDVLRTLRNRFAFVHQDAPMFMASIKENILFGHPQEDNAWKSIQKSWLYKLLPLGDSPEKRMVGDRGEGLSGGEARRLALIREWARSSELIILDEPLNHLDQISIDEIKREIVNFKSNAIVIVISHQHGFENIADVIMDF